jgi:hypothetical protein
MDSGTEIASTTEESANNACDQLNPSESSKMNKVVCFKHKSYQGIKSPELSCKVCCKIYVDKLRLKNKDSLEKFNIGKNKQKQVLEKRIQRRQNAFDSSWI